MHVVIVDGDVSYPANSGKRLRTLNLMLRLARRHRIGYICRANATGCECRTAADFLRDHGIEMIPFEHSVPPKSGPLFYARLAANLLSPVPYSVASHHTPRLGEAVRAYAARHAVDLWQFEWLPYAGAVEDPAARKVIMAHNVETLIWERYLETERNPLKRWYIRRQLRKFDRFERRTFQEAARVVTVSAEDARVVRERFGIPHVDVVDNGIDRAYYEPVQLSRDPARILFLGNLEWRPNLDAVRLMLDRVFPEVVARAPQARLSIVGRNPPEWLVQRAGSLAGVELHANVADVRPFLGQSGVMAVPLRIGGGSRLKILEALATGLPVVSTRIGAEGLCLRPSRDLVVVEQVEDVAGALVEAIREPAKAGKLAEHGRRVVLERYDWDPLADRLERVWEKCVRKEAATAVEEPLLA
jgi:glycosyltransferase involved in cell wall biosynthesis